MIRTSASPASATASLAASSGRHRNVTSLSRMAARLASGSFRVSSVRVIMVRSFRSARRSWIRRPVVPACPSINIFTAIFPPHSPAAQFGQGAFFRRRSLFSAILLCAASVQALSLPAYCTQRGHNPLWHIPPIDANKSQLHYSIPFLWQSYSAFPQL